MKKIYFPEDKTLYDIVLVGGKYDMRRHKTYRHFIWAIEEMIRLFNTEGVEGMVTFHNGNEVLAEMVQGNVKIHVKFSGD